MVPKRKIMERIYVKVSSDTDKTGQVSPTAITWDDGRVFRIESIRDFRPASAAGNSVNGDCFTVMVCGQEKHLFYELTDSIFAGRHGRWFVERPVEVPV